jgi:excinuclease ABC subunit C
MVVATPEGFAKSQYRKFNMKAADLVPGDDFAMMRAMLTRRFTRLQAEAPDGGEDWPDLVASRSPVGRRGRRLRQPGHQRGPR